MTFSFLFLAITNNYIKRVILTYLCVVCMCVCIHMCMCSYYPLTASEFIHYFFLFGIFKSVFMNELNLVLYHVLLLHLFSFCLVAIFYRLILNFYYRCVCVYVYVWEGGYEDVHVVLPVCVIHSLTFEKVLVLKPIVHICSLSQIWQTWWVRAITIFWVLHHLQIFPLNKLVY